MTCLQSPALLRRNIHMSRKSAKASNMTCMINDTNGIIPKNPSNMRAMTANTYARIFDIFILSFFARFFLSKCIDLLICELLFELDDLFSEVIFTGSSLLLWLEHTLARPKLELYRSSLKSKYLTDLVLNIANI